MVDTIKRMTVSVKSELDFFKKIICTCKSERQILELAGLFFVFLTWPVKNLGHMHQLLHASRSAYRFYNLMTALSIIKTNKSNFNSECGRLQPVFFHSDSMKLQVSVCRENHFEMHHCHN